MHFEAHERLILLVAIYLIGYFATIYRVRFCATRYKIKIAAPARYHGYCVITWSILIAVTCTIIGKMLLHLELFEQFDFLSILVIISAFGLAVGCVAIGTKFNARKHFEFISNILFSTISNLTLALTFIIIFVILINSWHFFEVVPITKFLFGTYWNPQTAGLGKLKYESFGLLPLVSGTLLITVISLLVAIPFGLGSAIYISEFASKKFKSIAKTSIELLAGIPTVVYGYFAAIIIGPMIRHLGDMLNLEVASESALAAGIVMGIMITPYIMTLSDDIISAVPRSLKEAAMALGFTKSETSLYIVLPVAIPGIGAAILLAMSRAIGETMIVTMAAGLSANMTVNPLESVTTITVQIVTLLMGDQEFGSVTTQSAFALALSLFVLTLILNILSSYMINKYKRSYE